MQFSSVASKGEDRKDALGDQAYQLIEQLYPICRSLTGNGVRETLAHLRNHIPLEIVEVPTGEQAFDWTVPKEWNVRSAHIRDVSGRSVVDFATCNLHVVSYSKPVNARMSLEELRPHLHSIPKQPTAIPYRTAYYNETWGFCLADEQLRSLPQGDYDVFIDSTLENGSLTYGELLIAGETSDEVLISTHICHPSLCNDNL